MRSRSRAGTSRTPALAAKDEVSELDPRRPGGLRPAVERIVRRERQRHVRQRIQSIGPRGVDRGAHHACP